MSEDVKKSRIDLLREAIASGAEMDRDTVRDLVEMLDETNAARVALKHLRAHEAAQIDAVLCEASMEVIRSYQQECLPYLTVYAKHHNRARHLSESLEVGAS